MAGTVCGFSGRLRIYSIINTLKTVFTPLGGTEGPVPASLFEWRLCEKPCYYRSTKEVNQMKGLTAICALIVGAVMFTNAQTPTVTNAELEKYRAKRVAAEEELRQKYAEMGFP